MVTANEKERIDSVRKETTKIEFNEVGISPIVLEDFVLRAPRDFKNMKPCEILKKVEGSLVRQFADKLAGSTLEQTNKICEIVSFGNWEVKLEEFTTYPKKREQLGIETLVSILKAKVGVGEFTTERYAHLSPAIIKQKLKTSEDEEISHTTTNRRITKKYHNHSWFLKKAPKEKFIVMDLPTILARTFLDNVLEVFIINNKEIYAYQRAIELVELFYNPTNNSIKVPENMESRAFLLDVCWEHGLIERDCKIIPDKSIDVFGGRSLIKTIRHGEEERLNNIDITMKYVMLKELLLEIEYVKEKVERNIRNTSDYAKSFETKKNINKATQEVMKENNFLKRYGYVELDNDVDLEKFDFINGEFDKLLEQIYIPTCNDHSFRIKKLGKHRAAGLYYSMPVKATIFDLDSPDAYCHELGHQIDHVLTTKKRNLSEQHQFIHIIRVYKDYVEDYIQSGEDDEFAGVMSGSTKYNKSYYFLPTEIFARSFEIYLQEKGIVSSLLKTKLKPSTYPNTDYFKKMVVKYFDKLFINYSIEPKPTVTAPAEEEPKLAVTETAEEEPKPEVTAPTEEPKPTVTAPAEEEPKLAVTETAEEEPKPEVTAPTEEPKPEVTAPAEEEPKPEVTAPAEEEPKPEVTAPAEEEPKPAVTVKLKDPLEASKNSRKPKKTNRIFEVEPYKINKQLSLDIF